MARGILSEHGVQSIVQRGNFGMYNEGTGQAGDADLFVKVSDAEKARDILEAYLNA